MAASLRNVCRADWDAVLELSRRALARREEQMGNPAWATREELESELAGWALPPEETLLVGESDEDGVVGFGGIEVLPGWDHVELYGPLVAPAYRGRKLGTALLETSIDVARRHGAARIVGAVGTRNASGRLLLEHHGFRPREAAHAVFRLLAGAHRPIAEAPPGVAVRRATPADLDAVLALYRESFPDGRFPETTWRRVLEQGTVYLAERDGEVVAFLDIDPSDRWLYHVGVTGAERERGVASYLVSVAVEDYWREHPGETLGLSVAADNVPALRLYRRQGFAPWLVLQSYELALR